MKRVLLFPKFLTIIILFCLSISAWASDDLLQDSDELINDFKEFEARAERFVENCLNEAGEFVDRIIDESASGYVCSIERDALQARLEDFDGYLDKLGDSGIRLQCEEQDPLPLDSIILAMQGTKAAEDIVCGGRTPASEESCTEAYMCNSMRSLDTVLRVHPLVPNRLHSRIRTGLENFAESREFSKDCLDSEKQDCLSELVMGLVSSLASIGDVLYGAGKKAVSSIGGFFRNVTERSYWAAKRDALANISISTPNIFASFEGFPMKIVDAVTEKVGNLFNAVNHWIKTDVFCARWEGTPHFSECLEPMESYGCLDCDTRVNGVCMAVGVIGFDAILLFATAGSGNLIAAAAKSAKAVQMAQRMKAASPLLARASARTERLMSMSIPGMGFLHGRYIKSMLMNPRIVRLRESFFKDSSGSSGGGRSLASNDSGGGGGSRSSSDSRNSNDSNNNNNETENQERTASTAGGTTATGTPGAAGLNGAAGASIADATVAASSAVARLVSVVSPSAGAAAQAGVLVLSRVSTVTRDPTESPTESPTGDVLLRRTTEPPAPSGPVVTTASMSTDIRPMPRPETLRAPASIDPVMELTPTLSTLDSDSSPPVRTVGPLLERVSTTLAEGNEQPDLTSGNTFTATTVLAEPIRSVRDLAANSPEFSRGSQPTRIRSDHEAQRVLGQDVRSINAETFAKKSRAMNTIYSEENRESVVNAFRSANPGLSRAEADRYFDQRRSEVMGALDYSAERRGFTSDIRSQISSLREESDSLASEIQRMRADRIARTSGAAPIDSRARNSLPSFGQNATIPVAGAGTTPRTEEVVAQADEIEPRGLHTPDELGAVGRDLAAPSPVGRRTSGGSAGGLSGGAPAAARVAAPGTGPAPVAAQVAAVGSGVAPSTTDPESGSESSISRAPASIGPGLDDGPVLPMEIREMSLFRFNPRTMNTQGGNEQIEQLEALKALVDQNPRLSGREVVTRGTERAVHKFEFRNGQVYYFLVEPGVVSLISEDMAHAIQDDIRSRR
jgi:hypothetical protein